MFVPETVPPQQPLRIAIQETNDIYFPFGNSLSCHCRITNAVRIDAPAYANTGINESSLKGYFHCDLDLPRAMNGTCDRSCLWGVHIDIRQTEFRRIQNIEYLATQLQTPSFAQIKALEQGCIQVVLRRASKRADTGIAKYGGKRLTRRKSRNCVRRRVVPASYVLMVRRTSHVGCAGKIIRVADYVRPRSSRSCIRSIVG